MKRIIGLLVVAACVCSLSARAQQSSAGFEAELNAFKKKVDEAQAAPAPAPAPAAAASPASSAPPPSPLGPAANLPVEGSSAALPSAFATATPTPEEMQAQQEAQVKEMQKKVDDATFDDALKMLMPLRPDQIRSLLDKFKDNRQSAEMPLAEPKPKIQVQTISLDPSKAPPVIKVSPNLVTTVTILDASGSPWPIQDISWGGKFQVTGVEEGGHVLRITPETAHGVGNLSVRLIDLVTPVTFTLQTGLEEVYYRFDARIPKMGPLAKAPLIQYGGIKTQVGGDDNLVQFLDGTPPGTAEKVTLDGVDGRTTAWRVSNRMYLRTPLTLLSPSWDSSVTSADGMNVYTLNDTPVILLSDEGRMVSARISDAK